jgi:hypothetical protein
MIGMKLAAPVIRDSGGGSIVNVSSVAALMAHYDAAYTASKWGLRGLTKTAAVEYAAWGIRVNSIHPGQIEETALLGSASPELAQSLRASIPMERAGTPSEYADLVLFFACDKSSFITGTEISVDGGYSSVVGEHVVFKFSSQEQAAPTRWAAELPKKKSYNVVAIAFANKMHGSSGAVDYGQADGRTRYLCNRAVDTWQLCAKRCA